MSSNDDRHNVAETSARQQNVCLSNIPARRISSNAGTKVISWSLSHKGLPKVSEEIRGST